MPLDLTTILPSISQSLNGTGFLFGSGTSREAGYQMMPGLTRSVISALTHAERVILDDVLKAGGATYDDATATPNIEQLADLVIAHLTNSGDARFGMLESRLRDLVVREILSVTRPNLDHHCKFFEALKKRSFGLPSTVWIFTTNYDLLFETAAGKVGVALENGFSGSTERFFDPVQFRSTDGIVSGRSFTPSSQLTVKLIKLHGSISWVGEASKFFERHPAALDPFTNRVMVLPRRRKVMDTLIPPYDTLFTHASRVIGSECKYLVSCGFSFSDEHINQHLLLPVMQASKCRMFALCQEEPTGVSAYNAMPNFNAGYETHLHEAGNRVVGATDLWMFSKFVDLF